MNPGRLKTSTVLTWGAKTPHGFINDVIYMKRDPTGILVMPRKVSFLWERERETGIQSPSIAFLQPPQYRSRSDLSKAADLFCGDTQLPVFIPHIFLSES